MRWIWSDDLAAALVRAGLAEQQQVIGLIRQPRAVAIDGSDPLEALAALADDDEPAKRQVA